MRRVMISALAVTVGIVSTAAFATDDPIVTRKKLMSSSGVAFYGVGKQMVEGKIDFNPVVAASVLATVDAVAYSFGDYFPEGSDQGDTRASPDIWTKMDDFQKDLAELREKTDAALASKPATLEDFKTAFGSINEVCSDCHKEFRLSRN